jgi:hypothetical protein
MAFGWKYLDGSWRNWNTLAPYKYQNGCELPELRTMFDSQRHSKGYKKPDFLV